jgi:hypothetical protein
VTRPGRGVVTGPICVAAEGLRRFTRLGNILLAAFADHGSQSSSPGAGACSSGPLAPRLCYGCSRRPLPIYSVTSIYLRSTGRVGSLPRCLHTPGRRLGERSRCATPLCRPYERTLDPREGHPECKGCAITSPAEGACRVCFGEKGCLWRALAEEAKEETPRHRNSTSVESRSHHHSFSLMASLNGTVINVFPPASSI